MLKGGEGMHWEEEMTLKMKSSKSMVRMPLVILDHDPHSVITGCWISRTHLGPSGPVEWRDDEGWCKIVKIIKIVAHPVKSVFFLVFFLPTPRHRSLYY